MAKKSSTVSKDMRDMRCRGKRKLEGKGKTILVVDDDRSVRIGLSRLLSSRGYAIVTAVDGESGWDAYKRLKPDLVLTDMRMPGVDGLELLESIRERDSSTPVILLTGYGEVMDAVQAMKNGAIDFIEKPFNGDYLLKRIQQSTLAERVLEPEVPRDKELISSIDEKPKRKARVLPSIQQYGTAEADNYKAMFGSVAHRLKGEFTKIGFSLDEIRQLVVDLPGVREECDSIERSVTYSQMFLQRLLDYLDLGQFQLQQIDILELLRKMEDLARTRLPSNVKLQIIVEHQKKRRIVSGNFDQLMGVLLELFDNALSVMQKKSGIIEFKLSGTDDNVSISIRDNGPGIPKKLLNKLLKQQVESKKGMGLGLLLSSKVIKALGGRLNLFRTSGRGTIFEIVLPVSTSKKEH